MNAAGASVPLGRSGVSVSRIGLGTAPLGGLFTPVSDAAAAETLAAAWDAGVRYFDTAPHYGLGVAERRLGAFLADRPRAEVVVSTKVGRLLRPGHSPAGTDGFHGVPTDLTRVWDFSAAGVRASLTESLERSGLDAFDLVLLHDPDDHGEQALAEAYPALAELRAEGVVRAVGAGMNQTAALSRLVTATDLDFVLVAGRYSLLDRSAAEALLPACAARGVGVLVGGVFNSGLLVAPRAGATFDYAPAPAPLLARARRLAARCAEFGVPLPAAAIQFPLRHPTVSGVLLGARDGREVTENMAHAAVEIPEELWRELDALAADDRTDDQADGNGDGGTA
ncbi:aldo/keto reductase [Streptomyces sp. DSM 44915]|uniref:Aldo/keto reductase n=1 Tax=Streptomyces chisholmiae TaxID=3075540 RepID=A0ABU2JN08_9ACTN|nr:aldo/keto reductase [Streptomyces sp. DSM 44915]MDT0266373.1 aldo/keto reductase [Streptomyces sp. DSM 44915]